MKKFYLFLTLLIFSLTSFSQGSEDFTNSTATATYADGSFVGNSGLTFFFGHSRDQELYPISGNGLMLRRASDSYLEVTIPSGVGNFSFDYRKAFTGVSPRQLELLVNGAPVAMTPEFGTISGEETTVYNFSYDVNSASSVVLRIKNIGTSTTNKQTVIDNIVWTAYTATCNTTSTISPSVCGTYTVPSGDETYTTSGTYMDTIPNAALCDSIITINLTVNPIYTGITDAATICNGQTYTFGTQSLTTAGSYTETFTSANGCDSTVTLTLSVVASFNQNISETICFGTTYTLGAQTLSTSGNYSETFTSVSGCDSIVNLDLTVLPEATSTLNISACDSYTSPSGLYTWTASGTYNDTVMSSAMCDSIITVNLTLGQSEIITTTETVCDSILFEGTYYTASGTYDVPFTNASGCDSIQRLIVTVNASPEMPMVSADQTLCTPALPTDLSVTVSQGGAALIISGIMDGPLTGGQPKAVEFFAIEDIADLSIYGFGSATNGGGTDGEEFTFPAVALTAGQYYYVATDSAGFNTFFGFDADAIETTASNVNGDDAIELFMNGAVIDVMGQIDVDGTGMPWEYLDGWAYRMNNSLPNGGVWNISEWTFSGIDVFDGQTTNTGSPTPFPIGTFTTAAPTITYEWYDDAAMTTLLGSGLTFATGQTSGTEDYFVFASSNGCTSEPASVTVTINETPVVALALTDDEACVNHAAFALAGGTPAGGTYTGTGVSAGQFDPAVAGIGTHTITYTYEENGCEASATGTITVDGCIGVEEIELTDVKVYPNPTTGLLTVSQEADNDLVITVTDLSGKTVVRNTVVAVMGTVDLSTVQAGQYILTIQSETAVKRMTVVKQ